MYSGSALVGYALVADADVLKGTEEILIGAIEASVASEATHTRGSIAGHPSVTGAISGTGYGIWVEAPYVKVIFALGDGNSTDLARAFATRS